MAAPRVFISSTYYDLKQIRNDIGSFIAELGYQPVRHEESSIPYTQDRQLEENCYDELSTCDIVVCIIGNMFGTKASGEELSITMKELERAIKERKKIYVFVEKSVWFENKTYQKNLDNPMFKPAAVDNIKIHQYVTQLQEKIGHSNPILPFESAGEIIASLKGQFAGLFQSLLGRASSLTEAKTVYDLQGEVNRLSQVVKDITNDHQLFIENFRSTVLLPNFSVVKIARILGLRRAGLILRNIWDLDELMDVLGFEFIEEGTSSIGQEQDAKLVGPRHYIRQSGSIRSYINVDARVFNSDGSFADLRTKKELEDYISKQDKECINEESTTIDEMPF